LSFCPNSDILASGSNDGFLRLWRINQPHSLTPILSVPMEGVINSLAIAKSGKFCVAGLGKEHRLGRWFHDKKARNSIVFVPLLP